MNISKYIAPVVLGGFTFLSVTMLANESGDYSPYVDDDYPNHIYFGDTHLHTSYSTDAGMIANTLGPALQASRIHVSVSV